MKVTFIGLGIMGSRMAQNLLNNNIELTVFNRDTSKSDRLSGSNYTIAKNIKSAVADADLVFTMLAHPNAVKDVMHAKDSGLSHMKENALWVDCSTINPSFSNLSQSLANNSRVRYLEAPVAGSKNQAQNAELIFFVGGKDSDLKEVEELLNFMGSKVMYWGEVGQGAAFKMIVNQLLGNAMVAFSEAIQLGTSMGLDKNKLLNVLPNLAVTAPFTKFKTEMIEKGVYPAFFPLELMHKDLYLAAICAYENNLALPMTNNTKEIFAQAKKSGFGRKDFAAVHAFLDQNE